MKTIQLTVLLLFLPFTFFAQSLTGLWVGSLSNDSTTVRKDQSFEIVLTQYKDKVYGYSRSTFIVNDTLFYIVKRVKGTIEADICEVKDDDIISYNFRGRLDKGVKMISTFRFNHEDSTWKMEGDWKTNKTKKYYSVSGKIKLEQEKDIEKSKIFPHLEELKLADDVAFYKESKKAPEPVAIIMPPAKDNKKEKVIKTDNPPVASIKETKTADVAKINQPVNDFKKDKPALEEKTKTAIESNNKKDSVAIARVKTEPIVQAKQPVTTIKKDSIAIVQAKPVIKVEPKKSEPVEPKKEVVIVSANAEIKKQEPVSVIVTPREKDKRSPVAAVIETKPVIPPAAAQVAERKIAPPQIVNFKSDSLELALYDNGEVDGDTVSVLLNGEIILAKQGLKASAIKKTIYVPAGTNDSFTLVLYAENLGLYPPNTGLLVIHDGDDIYQIRFSADLEQNAAIVFKRKRN